MSVVPCDSLSEIRLRIDELDERIVHLLAQRSRYVEQAAAFKKSRSDVRAPARASAVIDHAASVAVREGVDPRPIERIYQEIVAAFTELEMTRYALRGDAKNV